MTVRMRMTARVLAQMAVRTDAAEKGGGAESSLDSFRDSPSPPPHIVAHATPNCRPTRHLRHAGAHGDI